MVAGFEHLPLKSKAEVHEIFMIQPWKSQCHFYLTILMTADTKVRLGSGGRDINTTSGWEEFQDNIVNKACEMWDIVTVFEKYIWPQTTFWSQQFTSFLYAKYTHALPQDF